MGNVSQELPTGHAYKRIDVNKNKNIRIMFCVLKFKLRLIRNGFDTVHKLIRESIYKRFSPCMVFFNFEFIVECKNIFKG